MSDQRSDQVLRDERSLRLAAERRSAELNEAVATWRRRAEERAERIERLERERELPVVRRAVRTARRAWQSPDEQLADDAALATAPGTEPTGSRHDVATTSPRHRGFPSTRVVALVASDALRPLVDQWLPLDAEDERSWHETDVVVMDDDAWRQSDGGLRERLTRWAGSEGRSPWVRLRTGAADTDVPAGDLELRCGASGDSPRIVAPLAPDVPSGWTEPAVVVEQLDWDDPPDDLVAAAGAGRLVRAGADEERSRALAHRLAWRDHAPWSVAGSVLRAAGVDAAPAPTGVAALVVSMRPDEVVGAVRRVLASTHVDLEVVVGLHGFTASDELRRVVDAAAVPVTVLDLDRDRSLGACLNAAAAASTSPYLAKIDDDDHYGPGHLEDQLTAALRTGAALVGKAEQFTYVQSADRTVRRRVGTSHRWIDGVPTGGTWLLRRAVWERAPFPHRASRVDDLALGAIRADGGEVYVTGPWEFCFTRRTSGHTWVTDDESFLAGARPAWDGRRPSRVELGDRADW